MLLTSWLRSVQSRLCYGKLLGQTRKTASQRRVSGHNPSVSGELLEARTLLTGPGLVSISPNNGLFFVDGDPIDVRDEAPDELTVRFSPGQNIDPDTLDGIVITRSGGDDEFSTASITTDFGTDGAVAVNLRSLRTGSAGDGVAIVFSQTDHLDGSLPTVSAIGTTIHIDLNTNIANISSAEDLVQAISENPAASQLIEGSVLFGDPATDITTTTQAQVSATASTDFGLGGLVTVDFTAVQQGTVGNGVTLTFSKNDQGAPGLPVISGNGKSINVELNTNIGNESTMQDVVDAINTDPVSSALITAAVALGDPLQDVTLGDPASYSPVTFFGGFDPPILVLAGGNVAVATESFNQGDLLIQFTAVAAGATGEGTLITVDKADLLGPSQPVVVADAVAKTINVTLNTNVGNESTAQDLIDAINGDATAASLVIASIPVGNPSDDIATTAAPVTTIIPDGANDIIVQAGHIEVLPQIAPDAQNEVVFRFAESLPDDRYRIEITGAGVPATVATDLNTNGAVIFELFARAGGETGNAITLTVVKADLGGPAIPTISVLGNAITATLNTNLGNESTALDLVTAINNSPAASALVEARIRRGNGNVDIATPIINYSPLTLSGANTASATTDFNTHPLEVLFAAANPGTSGNGTSIVITKADLGGAMPPTIVTDLATKTITVTLNTNPGNETTAQVLVTTINADAQASMLVNASISFGDGTLNIATTATADSTITLIGGRTQLTNDNTLPGGGEVFQDGVDARVNFELDLGAEIISIVTQPVTRDSMGTLQQARDKIEVYFNDDNLHASVVTTGDLAQDPTVVDPAFYQLIFTNDTVRNTDDEVFTPTSITYDPVTDKAVLTFANNLDDLVNPTTGLPIGAASLRLRIGTTEAAPLAPLASTIVESSADSAFITANGLTLAATPFDTGSIMTVDGNGSQFTDGQTITLVDSRGQTLVLEIEDNGGGGVTTGNEAVVIDIGLPTLAADVAQVIVDAITTANGNGNTEISATRSGTQVNFLEDAGITLDNTIDAITLTSQGIIISSNINNVGQPYTIDLPGARTEPGHRDIANETHVIGDGDSQNVADTTVGISTQAYNFRTDYGVDPGGNPLFNVITEAQKQRAREAFEFWGEQIGITFIETARQGWQIVTGDLRVVGGVPGPLGQLGRSGAIPALPGVAHSFGRLTLVLDNAENWDDSFGAADSATTIPWFVIALHEIGHLLGFGESTELPPGTIMAHPPGGGFNNNTLGGEQRLLFNNSPAEPVFLGDQDIVHGQFLFRPESKDIDLYRFEVETGVTGLFTAETFAERMPDESSRLDTALSLYRETKASVTSSFNTNTELEITLTAVDSGPDGNEISLIIIKTDQSGPLAPIITADLATSTITAELNTAFGFETRAQDLVLAINEHPMARQLVVASIGDGDPTTNIATPAINYSPLLLSGAGRELIAQNDDYYSSDSFVEVMLGQGTYYIGVSASKNQNYNPEIQDSGIGGTTEGDYDLRLNFRQDVDLAIVDIDNASNVNVSATAQRTALDGDLNGTPGGVYNFWFRTADPRIVQITGDGSVVADGDTVTLTDETGVVRTFEFEDAAINDGVAMGNVQVDFDSGVPTSAADIATALSAAINTETTNAMGNDGFDITAFADGTNVLTSGDSSATIGMATVGVAVDRSLIIVDKSHTPDAMQPLGTLSNPFNNIGLAFAAANEGDVVRIQPNGGADGILQTLDDNLAYQIGTDRITSLPLSDGSTMAVPHGVHVKIDAGTIFQLRKDRIGVGSSSTTDRSGGSLQVMGTPNDSVYFTSYNVHPTLNPIGVDTNPDVLLPAAGDWGGLDFRNDLDRADGRFDYEREGVFLNYVNHADIGFGGGIIRVNSVDQVVTPIQMLEARPTVSFNTIRLSADSAISADPNSFEDENFHAPRSQLLGTFTSDYERIGPDLDNNLFVNNSINGLFVRIVTRPGDSLKHLTIPGRFDDADVTHIVAQNLIIEGQPGSAIRDRVAPPTNLIIVNAAPGGTLAADTYDYRLSNVDAFGFEGPFSEPTTSVTVTGGPTQGSVLLTQLPPVPAESEFVARRLYRLDPASGEYELVKQINGDDTSYLDDGTTVGSFAEVRGVLDLTVRVVEFTGGGSVVMDGQTITLTDGAGVSRTFELVDFPGAAGPGNVRVRYFGAFSSSTFLATALRNAINNQAGFNVTATTDGSHVLLTGAARGSLSMNAMGMDIASRDRPRLDARLRIDPGVVVKVDGSRFEAQIGSQFIAEGLPGRDVIFTSLRDDRYGKGGTFDTNNDDRLGAGESVPGIGDWGGIYFGHFSSGSLDRALVTFGGGITAIEGTFAGFNAVEIHQADVRITNTTFERNADGQGGQAGGTGRFGRATNEDAVIFIRGAQPIIVDNIVQNNLDSDGDGANPAISINVNALNFRGVEDTGRLTGLIDQVVRFPGNQGPMIRANSLFGNSTNGMIVRGQTLTTQSVWDDTDITHVLFDTIHVPDLHTYGGLRLQSSATESLVIKLFGNNAGFEATGRPLEIDDRIGGTFAIVGVPGFPVVFTSLRDDTIGAGFDPNGKPLNDTNSDGTATVAAPGDWDTIQLDQYSHDRNVEVVVEREAPAEVAPGVNSFPNNAQFVGLLADTLQGGDENLRLGFEITGSISAPNDVDIYSFEAAAGTEVWIDVDKTTHTLDTVIEFIDDAGNIIALSDNSITETAADDIEFSDDLVIPDDDVNIMTRTPFETVDFFTTNPRDAGMRIVLPGPMGTRLTYLIRIRSSNIDTLDPMAVRADLIDPTKVLDGLTAGTYQMQIRLQQIDEFPGSTIQFSDIRFANVGITIDGLPLHSTLTGEAVEREPSNGQGTNDSTGGADNLGNILNTDRSTLSIAGRINSFSDADFYRFTVNYDSVQSPGGSYPFVFDVDYADGLARVDSNLVVYNANGSVQYWSSDSNISDDRPSPNAAADLGDLTRGSIGALDPYLGTVELGVGTYFAAVISDARQPIELNQFTQLAATNPNFRLEPVRSVDRIAEDHVYFDGGETPQNPTTLVPLFTSDAENITPFHLGDVILFVSQDTINILGDLTNSTTVNTVNPFTGAVVTTVGTFGENTKDIAFRTNGDLHAFETDLADCQASGFLCRLSVTDNDSDGYFQIDTGTGAGTKLGDHFITTFELDVNAPPNSIRSNPVPPNGTRVGDGIHVEALDYAFTNDGEQGYFIGNRPPGVNPPGGSPNSPGGGAIFTENILYLFDETNGRATSLPLPDRAVEDLADFTGTPIVERAVLFTDPNDSDRCSVFSVGFCDPENIDGIDYVVTVSTEVTTVSGTGTEAARIISHIHDGDTINTTSATFEIDLGPEYFVEHSNADHIIDGDSFTVDGNRFEFNTGPVLVVTNGAGLFTDGATFVLTDNPGRPVTFEFDTNDMLMNAANTAIPIMPFDNATDIAAAAAFAINTRGMFSVVAEQEGTRLTLTGDSTAVNPTKMGDGSNSFNFSGTVGIGGGSTPIDLEENTTLTDFATAVTAAGSTVAGVTSTFEGTESRVRLSFTGATTVVTDVMDMDIFSVVAPGPGTGTLIPVLVTDNRTEVAIAIAAVTGGVRDETSVSLIFTTVNDRVVTNSRPNRTHFAGNVPVPLDAADDFYNGKYVIFTTGNLTGQSALILDYGTQELSVSDLELNEGFVDATAATRLVDITNLNGGLPFVDGDVIDIEGRDLAGALVSVPFVIDGAGFFQDDLQDLLDAIEIAFGANGGVTAIISEDGEITVAADNLGDFIPDLDVDLTSQLTNTSNVDPNPLGDFFVVNQTGTIQVAPGSFSEPPDDRDRFTISDGFLSAPFMATDNPTSFAIGGTAPDNGGATGAAPQITGMAFGPDIPGNDQLWVVTDTGGLYEVTGDYRLPNYVASADYVNTASELIGIQFEGLSLGPQTVEGGRYANLLFGITNTGDIHAFNFQGQLQPIFNDGATSVSTGIINATGLDFSQLDRNLFITDLENFSFTCGLQNDQCHTEFEDYDFPGGAHGSIESNTFSLEGYQVQDQPFFYYDYFRQTAGADSLRVLISRDDGAWTLLGTGFNANQNRQDRISLNAFAGLDNLKLRIEFSTSGSTGLGNGNNFSGAELRAIPGEDLRDGDTFTIFNPNATFEIELGYTLVIPTGAGITDGEIFSVDGTVFEFEDVSTDIMPDGQDSPLSDVLITYDSDNTANQLAQRIATAIGLIGFTPRLPFGSNRLNIDPNGGPLQVNASDDLVAAGFVEGMAGIQEGRREILVHAQMSKSAVQSVINPVLADVYANSDTSLIKQFREVNRVIGHTVDSGPLGLTTFLPGDAGFTLNTRGQNNNLAGVTLDDFVIGFAERGERATGSNAGATGFQTVATTSITSGSYQLEIRRGTGFNTASTTARTFDTNDRLDQLVTFINVDGNNIFDSQNFTLSDGVDTLTFEFEDTSLPSIDPTNRHIGITPGTVLINFTPGETDAAIAVRIRDAINSTAVQAVLDLKATSSNGIFSGPSFADNQVNIYGTANSDVSGRFDFFDPATGNGINAKIHGVFNTATGPDNDGFQLDPADGTFTPEHAYQGDRNHPRPQGQVIIAGNLVINSETFGISVTPGDRTRADLIPLGGSLPHPGPVRNFDELNIERLATGVTITNNVLAKNRSGGILFSGDPNAGAVQIGPVPFGRLTNNTIFGVRAGDTGIQVQNNASPTLFNNVIANTNRGISVDGSSSTTIIGGTYYQDNTTDSTTTLGDFPLVLPDGSPLFVNTATDNYYLTDGSRAIDAAIDSLDDRFELTLLRDPLDIPRSPILAPERDAFGQLRVDDPGQVPPPGQGANVFKDRGAIERADFFGPTAVLVTFDDVGVETVLQENDVDIILENPVLLTDFVIKLNDEGIGIDDMLIDHTQVKLLRDGVEQLNDIDAAALGLTPDYFFDYNSNTNRLKLTALTKFALDHRYQIQLQNIDEPLAVPTPLLGIRDLAGNLLVSNQVDGSGESRFDILVTNGLNDAPVNIVPTTRTVLEDNSVFFSSAAGIPIVITDPDAFLAPAPDTDVVQVQLTATNGVLNFDTSLPEFSNLTFVDGFGNPETNPANDGTADTVIRFRASIGNINAALEGIEFEPDADFFGAGMIEVETIDLGNFNAPNTIEQTDTDSILINVLPVNDPPVFTIASNPATVDEDAGPQVVAGFSSGFTTGPANESSQNLTGYTITPTGGTLAFAMLPNIDESTGNLTYESAPDSNGTASFSVTLSDDGPTGLPQDNNTSAAQTFTISVTAVNDAPVLENRAVATEGFNQAALSIQFLATNPGAAGIGTTITVNKFDQGGPGLPTIVVDTGAKTISVTLNSNFGNESTVQELVDTINLDSMALSLITTSIVTGDPTADVTTLADPLTTITLTIVDPVFPSITEDEPNSSNIGELVSVLIGASISDVDAGAVEGIAVTGADNSNGEWQFTIDGGSIWTPFGAVTNASAVVLSDTVADRIRFVPAADFNGTVDPGITFRAWDRTDSNPSGAMGIDTSTNGTPTAYSTGTETVAISVGVENDAPVLDNSGDLTLTAIDEDSPNGMNPGTLISDIVGVSIMDVDAGAVEGIAVIGVDDANGQWQFSTDGGGSFSAFGSVSDSMAVLLAATANELIRFVPNADFNGDVDPGITFRAWDRTTGSSGTVGVNITSMGGTSAFSTATETAAITLNPINDAPALDNSGTPALSSIVEGDVNSGGTLISNLIAGIVGDVDAGSVEGIAVTSVDDTNGVWQYSTDGGNNWNPFGLVSDVSAIVLADTANDLVRFVPQVNFFGTIDPGLTFRAWDRTDGNSSGTTSVNASANGGITQFSSDSETATITVTQINDAPVLDDSGDPILAAIDEDITDLANRPGTLVSDLIAGIIADVDVGALQGIAVINVDDNDGQWEFSINGGTDWTAFGAVGDSNAVVLSDTANDRVRFFPSADFNGTVDPGLTFRAWDRSDGSVTGQMGIDASTTGGMTPFSLASETASIIVNPINDAPLLDNSMSPTLDSIDEDILDAANTGTQVSDIIAGIVNEVDAGAQMGIAVITVDDSNGEWQYSIDGGTSFTAFGTIADTAAVLLGDSAMDLIRFVPNADFDQVVDPGIVFRAWDQTQNMSGDRDINVSANGGTTPYSLNAESASITMNAINDAPLLDNSGSLTLSTIDEDDTGNNGDLVSDIVGTSINDVDTGAVEGVAITAVDDTNGQWEFSTDGMPFTTFGNVSNSSAVVLGTGPNDRIRFVPNADFNGTVSTGLTFRAWDQSDGLLMSGDGGVDTTVNGMETEFSTTSETVSIIVDPVNDAPLLNDAGDPMLTGILEDVTDVANTGTAVADIIGTTITDIDAGAVEGIAVTSIDDSNGVWQYSTNAGATWSAFGSISDTSAVVLKNDANSRIRFVPNLDFNGQVAPGITYQAWDQTELVPLANGATGIDVSVNGDTTPYSSTSETASIDVGAVNDPTVANDDVYFVAQGATLTTTDVDGTTTAGDSTDDGVLANDIDVDSPLIDLTVIEVSGTGEGTLTLNNDGTFTYVHGGGTVATDNFSYEVDDGIDVGGTADVTININFAPVIGSQSIPLDENTANNTLVGMVTATDPNAGDTLSFSISGGNTNNAFTIDSVSGEIRVNNSAQIDFEANQSIVLTVDVTDVSVPLVARLTSSGTVTIDLNDLVETLTVDPGDFPASGAITLFIDGGDLRIVETGTMIDVVPSHAFGSVSDVVITGRDGADDELTVDFSGGTPIPAGDVNFSGGSAGGTDTLSLISGTVATVTHEFGNLTDGSVVIDDGSALSINYTEVEPISDSLDVTDRVFTFGNTGDDITLGDNASGGDTISQISSIASSSTVAFTNPSGSIVLNADNGGTGNDLVTINTVDTTFAGTITINGGGGDDELDGLNSGFGLNLNGGAGSDSLTGSAGNDAFDGGSGTDRIEQSGDVDQTLTDSQLTGFGTDSLTNVEQVQLTGGDSANELNAGGYTSGSVTLSGAGGADTLTGGSGADILNGGGSGDQIDGSFGPDTINGGSGNDSITGGSGSDNVDGGSGTDVYIQTTNANQSVTDTQVTGQGNDDITRIERVMLIGGSGDNVLDASSFSKGAVTLMGGGGSDTLTGGDGSDDLDGGSGTDVVAQTSNSNQILTNSTLVGLGTDTLTSIENANLTGGSLSNLIDATDFSNGSVTIDGTAGNDTLLGGSQDDVLIGGGGRDSIRGGSGDDTIDGGAGSDILIGNGGIDVLRQEVGGDQTLTNTLLTGEGSDALDGTIELITLIGDNNANTIDASIYTDGSVTIMGLGGDDVLIGGSQADRIEGGDGADSLLGGAGNDKLIGKSGPDTLNGQAGSDSVFGGSGGDDADGGSGDDTVDGQSGNDTVRGGTGDDELRGGNDDDSILAGPGNDFVLGGRGNDTMDGQDGNDLMRGEDGDDVFFGRDGNDTLNGGNGADILIGGAGRDRMAGKSGPDFIDGGEDNDKGFGGAGADRFVASAGTDTLNGQGGIDSVSITIDNGNDDVQLTQNGTQLRVNDNAAASFAFLLRTIESLSLATGSGNDVVTIGDLSGLVDLRTITVNTSNGNNRVDASDLNAAISLNVITGNGSDTVFGGAGDDTVDTGEGNDTLVGGLGNDSLIGGGGRDAILGQEGNDVLIGRGGNDILAGEEGDDTIFGGAGRDQITGEAGDDKIDGQGRTDTISGGDGNDDIQDPLNEINEAFTIDVQAILDGI